MRYTKKHFHIAKCAGQARAKCGEPLEEQDWPELRTDIAGEIEDDLSPRQLDQLADHAWRCAEIDLAKREGASS